MSIILDGIRDVDLGFRVLEGSLDPILPDSRDRIVTIPGRQGALDFGAELEPRYFEFECIFVADGTNYNNPSAQELQNRIRQLASLLTDKTGIPRMFPLIIEREPNKHYMVRYSGSLGIERIIYSSVGTFTLPLVAYDPFAYGVEETINFTNNTATVTNTGTVETFPIFIATFTSAATEWKVSLGSKFVRVVRNFTVGEVLEVDCATGKININGTNIISYLDWQNSQFFSLLPGQSILTVTPAGVSKTEIKYSPRWV